MRSQGIVVRKKIRGPQMVLFGVLVAQLVLVSCTNRGLPPTVPAVDAGQGGPARANGSVDDKGVGAVDGSAAAAGGHGGGVGTADSGLLAADAGVSSNGGSPGSADANVSSGGGGSGGGAADAGLGGSGGPADASGGTGVPADAGTIVGAGGNGGAGMTGADAGARADTGITPICDLPACYQEFASLAKTCTPVGSCIEQEVSGSMALNSCWANGVKQFASFDFTPAGFAIAVRVTNTNGGPCYSFSLASDLAGNTGPIDVRNASGNLLFTLTDNRDGTVIVACPGGPAKVVPANCDPAMNTMMPMKADTMCTKGLCM